MYLDRFSNQINELCIKNKVKSLYVFGSVLTNKFDDQSDIDLIVDIDLKDPFEYADSYFNLKFALQDLFKRPVDLLESKAVKNPYIKQNIDQSKSLVYAK
jgi:uncharacterized protein